MLARLGIGEIIIIGLVAFLIFGPQKLPELGKSFGETVRNFKSAVNETVLNTVEEKMSPKEKSEEVVDARDTDQ